MALLILHRYCNYTARDPEQALRDPSINVLWGLFNFVLELGMISKATTVQTYWNILCQIWRQETGCRRLHPRIQKNFPGVGARLPLTALLY